MSNIDYYSKYKKYKTKYLLLQNGGDIEKYLTEIKKLLNNHIQDVLKKIIEKNPKINNLFNIISKLNTREAITAELKKHINDLKEFIGKLISELPFDIITKGSIKASLKVMFMLNSDIVIEKCTPIIEEVLKHYKTLSHIKSTL